MRPTSHLHNTHTCWTSHQELSHHEDEESLSTWSRLGGEVAKEGPGAHRDVSKTRIPLPTKHTQPTKLLGPCRTLQQGQRECRSSLTGARSKNGPGGECHHPHDGSRQYIGEPIALHRAVRHCSSILELPCFPSTSHLVHGGRAETAATTYQSCAPSIAHPCRGSGPRGSKIAPSRRMSSAVRSRHV